MKVLSIETSCDETAAAIVKWDGKQASVLANTVSSQASLHAKWGGVVPDLASREHIKNIVPVVEETLERAKLSPAQIDLLAVTEGPGLMPALVIGVSAAKLLSLLWNKPLLGIQHLEGHIYANLLKKGVELRFPLLALVVSGGHTELVLMRDHFQYEILGETQDDAAGEAFDKVAKLLGLPYPGGPQVAKRADAFRENHTASEIQELTEKFPRPMLTADNFDFSFSGLKTSVLYSLKKEDPEKLSDETFVASMCHAFQEAVVDVLVGKTEKALRQYAPETFVIAGGVSANIRLRQRLETLIADKFPETQFLTPDFAYSLDNAAMIAIAAALRYEHMNEEERSSLTQTFSTMEPNANMPLASL
jgi:N6-L-threonylcarbamoyladenine synthase